MRNTTGSSMDVGNQASTYGYNWKQWATRGLMAAGGLTATAAAMYYGGPALFTGIASRFNKLGENNQDTGLSLTGQEASLTDSTKGVSHATTHSPVRTTFTEIQEQKRDQEDLLGELERHSQKEGTQAFFKGLTEDNNFLEDINEEKEDDIDDVVEEILSPAIRGERSTKRGPATPVIVNNEIILEKGAALVLTPNELSATDNDDNNADLTFIVNSAQHGQFEAVSNPGVPVIAFKQQKVMDNQIQFVHDNSTVVPAYDISVSDCTSRSEVDEGKVSFFTSSDIYCQYKNEFQVNTYTANSQNSPAVTGLADGKFVVTWSGAGAGDASGIYGQMYYGNGTTYGNEFRVNTYTDDSQRSSAVTGFADGKFVVTWYGYGSGDRDGYGIYGQKYDENGITYGNEFRVNSHTRADQLSPSVTGLADGKFVVTWQSYYQDYDYDYGIYGQMYDGNGTPYGSEFRVNSYTDYDQLYPSVTGFADGKFVVTWYGEGIGDTVGIYGQMYDGNGIPYGNEFRVNTYTTSHQYNPSVTGLADGRFVVTWKSDMDFSSFTSNYDIRGQMYYGNGTTYGSEFQVNTYTANSQSNPAVTGLADGKFVVTWSGSGVGDGSGVYGQMYAESLFLLSLVNNKLTIIEEFGPLSLSENDISVTNACVFNNIIFDVTNVAHGQFELIDNPNNHITSFTQQQIIDREIHFIHDGSNVAPAYQLSVSDGFLSTLPEDADVSLNEMKTYGNEFRVNGYTYYSHINPAITGLTDGKFVVTWNLVDSNTVYGRIYNGDGGGYNIFEVDADAEAYLSDFSSVTGLSDGKFVVTWRSYGQDGDGYGIYGQMYYGNGTTYGNNFQVNTYTDAYQQYPAVTGLTDGKFVVTWQSDMDSDYSYEDYDIRGQMYYRNGTAYGSEFRVNPYSREDQLNPSVTGLADGKFVVTWQSDMDSSSTYDYNIRGQMYYGNGTAYGNEFQVNTNNGYFFESLATVGLADGKFVVTYEIGSSGGNNGIWGQMYDGNGIPYGNEFRVKTYATSNSVTGLADGKFVVTWQSYGDGDNYGIYGQIYNGDGTVYGTEFQVNTYTDDGQINPAVTGLADGKFVVTWQSYEQDSTNDYGIYGQMYEIKYSPTLSINQLTIDQKSSTVSLTASDLSATDTDFEDNDADLTFTVSDILEGKFEEVSNPNTPITSFIQSQITNGTICFVPSTNNIAPSYKVSVSDGTFSTSPSIASIVFHYKPELGNNTLTLNEEQTVVLTEDNLSAKDEDSDYDYNTLMFTPTGIQYGQFEAVSTSLPVTDFTQQQVKAGEIQFVHDGGEDAPAYNIMVTDCEETNSTVSSAVINFTNVNDVPVLGNNNLSVNEGQTVVLTGSNLNATDIDNDDSTLIFSPSIIYHGHFENTDTTNVTIIDFTQQQVTDGKIVFIHDGGEIEPSYNIVVSDGELITTPPSAANITFVADVNDIPELVTNMLSLDDGETVVLGGINLSATDSDNDYLTLTFEIRYPLEGFFVNWHIDDSIPIMTFTQENIANGAIQFKHNGSGNPPSYEVRVSDGEKFSDYEAAEIGFKNKVPVLVEKSLTIIEGGDVILDQSMLSATDADHDNASLTFLVYNVQHGQFEHVNDPTHEVITSFVQQEVIDGDIVFIHDGSETAPSFNIAVTDGFDVSAVESATISFINTNDCPVLTNNSIDILEGETIVLNSNNLSADDVDSDNAALVFAVNNVQHGRFEDTSNTGIPITSFTQAEISSNGVQFVHNGDEFPPQYDITVSDLQCTTTPPEIPTITFTDVNDEPKIGNNHLIINEGQTVELNASMLSATDDDNDNASLIFTVTNVQNGYFENKDNPTFSIPSFTQQQITDGKIRFVHDDGESPPSYNVVVTDTEDPSPSASAGITFTNVNDDPKIESKNLKVTGGSSVTLTTDMIKAIDDDNTNAELRFTVSNVQNGHFDRINPSETSITHFTQEEVINGNIQFTHDGSIHEPVFSISVYDGEVTVGPEAGTVDFTPKNILSKLGNNQLTIDEGQTVVLNNLMLSATDEDNDNSGLSFNIINPQHGFFADNSKNENQPITAFTQEKITEGAIQFTHDGGEIPPSYSVSIYDGEDTTDPVAATITFTNVNDIPVLGNNRLTITQGHNVRIASAYLSATDEDNNDSELLFTVSNVLHGHFAYASDMETPITTFVQEDVTSTITNRHVYFVHDGSDQKPSYDVTVSDAEPLTTSPAAATVSPLIIPPNVCPNLDNNQLEIEEGEIVQITPTELRATDGDGPESTLTFDIIDPMHGQFERISNPGSSVTIFTQQEITSGAIRFVHDGGELPPSFNVTVSDTEGCTSVSDSADIHFTDINDIPELINNQLSVNEGGTVVLTPDMLSAIDEDNVDEELIFIASGVQRGHFEVQNDAGAWVEASEFTQQEVIGGDVRFVHTGDTAEPTYDITVSDGTDTTDPEPVTVSYKSNDTTVKDTSLGILAGTLSSVLGVAILASGAGVLMGVKRKYIDKNSRLQHPFPNALYNRLPFRGVRNFNSRRGKEFVEAIEGNQAGSLKSCLGNEDINVNVEEEEELSTLASDVAEAIEDKVSQRAMAVTCLGFKREFTTDNIKTLAGEIAKRTKAIRENDNRRENGMIGDSSPDIPMHKINKL